MKYIVALFFISAVLISGCTGSKEPTITTGLTMQRILGEISFVQINGVSPVIVPPESLKNLIPLIARTMRSDEFREEYNINPAEADAVAEVFENMKSMSVANWTGTGVQLTTVEAENNAAAKQARLYFITTSFIRTSCVAQVTKPAVSVVVCGSTTYATEPEKSEHLGEPGCQLQITEPAVVGTNCTRSGSVPEPSVRDFQGEDVLIYQGANPKTGGIRRVYVWDEGNFAFIMIQDSASVNIEPAITSIISGINKLKAQG